ncbi:hypothetical protein LDENG_00267720 [Lucifuga dentata]|nr:hypothetical protein LDENG_00267720 [Lucifuga dentata]
MAEKGIVLCALLVALLLSCLASPPQLSSEKNMEESKMLQQLLAKVGGNKETVGPWEQAFQTRMERRAHLSEDEREVMTKQIMQVISEMMNSECLSDRDYQGWVDFGRRSAE